MEEQPTPQATKSKVTQGMQVKRAREERGWSQSDLAQRIGVTSRTVKRWEANKSSPHGYTSQKLSRVLNKSEEELAVGKLTEEPDLTNVVPPTHPDVKRWRWQRTRHPLVLLFIATLLVILIGATLLLSSIYQQHSGPLSSLTSSLSTPPPKGWNRLLRQSAPNCQNPKGVVWYVHLKGTSLSCNASGLVMKQIAAHPYAEVDLVKVNNSIYNQTTFRTQVQVTFQNPIDTSTWAALLVQTPAAVGVVGGYIFTLSPQGQWQLQYVATAMYIPIVKHGSVSINSKQPVRMVVEVQRNVLYGFINNQQVVSYQDNLNPAPGQIGLLVEGQPSVVPSSAVQFSDFELDE